MATILRLEALTVPRKTYELNAEALEDLATVQARSRMTETAAITVALRNLAEMMTRGIPVYLSELPEGPVPPTSAPSAATSKTLRAVEIPGKKRTAYSKRGKKQ
jgi:hypothetical protein